VLAVWCGFLVWVFTDPGRREFVRSVLMNTMSGEVRGSDGKVMEPR
jgi:hypothetical protein